MAVVAAERALASAGREASEIDAVLATAFTDNNTFPTTAGMVQMRLGCRQVRASTLQGACACETETFQVAAEMLAASTARLVLVVASDGILTNALHILDWKASSIFGEGAAAFLLERGETDDDETFTINGYNARQGPALFYQTALRKDACDIAEMDRRILQLYQQGAGEEIQKLLLQKTPGYAHMNGYRVYQTAPRAMAECVDVLCRLADLSPHDLMHIIPHQPNVHMVRRIGELLIQEFGWPETTVEKVAYCGRYVGNLSNASIGVALVEMLRSERLQSGHWIVLPAVGGGMHYGGCLLRYQGIKHVEQSIQPQCTLSN
jgi:3-oxoacyl-[acyl-carrier-protein] synthase-3